MPAPVDENGLQECSVTLTEGMTSIVAEVRDPSDEAGRFELAFVIDVDAAGKLISAQVVSFMQIKPSCLKASFRMMKTNRLPYR